VVVTPGNGVAFQWRSAAGALPNQVNVTGLGAPLWVMLVRAGNDFSGFYSTNGTTWTQIGTTQNLGIRPTAALAGLAVTAHNNGALNTALFADVALLPSGWGNADIGSPGYTGYTSYNSDSGTWAIGGGGSDIWNDADQFHFASERFSGDGEAVARVLAVQYTDQWAKAGVMWRDSADAGAKFVDVVVTPDNGVAFQWRSSTGGQCNNVNLPGFHAPMWVRLVRAGNTFTGYYSSDGGSWTRIGTPVTVAMSTNALVGLAVTAHNDSVLSASRLDNVSVAAPGPGPGADLSGASNRIGTVTGGTPLVGGWDGNGSAYPSGLPGVGATAGGWAFGLGGPGSENAVQGAGQTGALPAGTGSTSVFDDGTGDTFAQSLSDWASPSTGKRLGNSTALSGSARAKAGPA
jgi:hypothetical protein